VPSKLDRHTNEQTDKKSEPFDTRSCQDRALALGHATDTRTFSWAEQHRRGGDGCNLQCKAKLQASPSVYLPEDPLTSRTSCHAWRVARADLWSLTVFTPHRFRGTQKTKRRVQTPATWSSQWRDNWMFTPTHVLSSSSPCLNQHCVALPWIKWSVLPILILMVMAGCGCMNCRKESSLPPDTLSRLEMQRVDDLIPLQIKRLKWKKIHVKWKDGWILVLP
jgi:hypothetical protein